MCPAAKSPVHLALTRLVLPFLALLATPALADDAPLQNYSEARASELQQDYAPKPAIWRVTDGDTTIYLFGTIHMIPKGFRWRTDSFNSILHEVDELVLETPSNEAMEATSRWGQEMLSASNSRPSLSSRLSEESGKKLHRLANETNLPIGTIERLPLWMTISAISAVEDDKTEFGRNFGVEIELEAQFARLNKPVSGIESPLWVLRRLSSFDDSQMLAQFELAMANWKEDEKLPSTKEILFLNAIEGQPQLPDQDSKNRDSYIAMLHDWAQGNVAAMEGGLTVEALGPGFYDALIAARNRNWATWIDTRLDRPGRLMVAVGAGHLSGPDSLVTLLEQRGFKAKRIQ